MQFVVIGRDGDDPQALQRRLGAREAHIKLGDDLFKSGNMLLGVALINEEGNMVGSNIVVDFPSRKELDEWLAIEPYVTENVWETIEIQECRVGPSFARLFKKES